MAIYNSDGKKLVDVEYDTIVQVGDIVDTMRVVSSSFNTDNEQCLFLLDGTTRQINCYILDEIFIIGKTNGFDTLNDAVEAWNNNEI